jgi:hypothetical protein
MFNGYETNLQVFGRVLRKNLAKVGLFPVIVKDRVGLTDNVVRVDVVRLSRHVREPTPRLCVWSITEDAIKAATDPDLLAIEFAGKIDQEVDERLYRWTQSSGS